jgi:hypothetical protein
VSALEGQIDELYQAPLEEFTTRRNALAKTLKGEDAQRVKKLAKPTVVPWVTNQLYWKARPLYDRLLKSGDRLRDAQLGALEGRGADVRAATDTHRKALIDAVKEAERLAAAAGSHPAADALMRTFEALSLMRHPPAPAGRLTEALQPAGFEALAGVPVRTAVPVPSKRHAEVPPPVPREEARKPHVPKIDLRKEAEARKRAEAAARLHEAAVKRAEAALVRAKAAAAAARHTMERADADVKSAEGELRRLQAHRV